MSETVILWLLGVVVIPGGVGLTAFLFRLWNKVQILEKDALNGGKSVINQRLTSLERELLLLREWRHDVGPILRYADEAQRKEHGG